MSNVTEMNVKNETQNILDDINMSISYREVDEDEIGLERFIDDLSKSRYYKRNSLPREISKKYDLEKFFKSLTDEEVNWNKKVSVSGMIEQEFTHTPPEDIWDDEDALQGYISYLDPDDVYIDYSEIVNPSVEVSFTPEVVSSTEVIAKLEDAKLQIKKYELKGSIFELVETNFEQSVDATSLEDAKSKVSFELDDNFDALQFCTFNDQPEVQWSDGEKLW